MYPEVEPVKQNQNIAPTAQTHRERVIAAIGRSQSVNDGLAKALRELTGLNLDRPSKTDQSYIAELRQWEATPAQCAHFAHYWQVVEKWRGEAARPALKTIRDRWEFAMAWSPAPVMATQFKDV